jgi:hypothetical protein
MADPKLTRVVRTSVAMLRQHAARSMPPRTQRQRAWL